MTKAIAIVGAGPGVGMAVARKFGREGFKVALLARNAEKLDALVGELASAGIDAAAFRTDVIDRAGLVSALRAAGERFGSIDVLEYSPTPSADTMRRPREIDVQDEQLHLNMSVLGAIAAVRAVLPGMIERKEGAILFTTAASAQHPIAMTANFGVAAGALLNYARLLNKDLAADGIYAGIVSIAGLVVQRGQGEQQIPSRFPPGMPLLTAEEVAELHWALQTKRDRAEAFAGDIEALLTKSGLYRG